MDFQLLDTVEGVSTLVDIIAGFQNQMADLFLDFESNKLSRRGTLAIMTIFVASIDTTFLVDITTLKETAFSTIGASSNTNLKTVLEDPSIIKVFFDVRSDSDALFNLYGITLGGVEDLQLMEFACGQKYRTEDRLLGLTKCILASSKLDGAELQAWLDIKEQGKRRFSQNEAIFDHRPLDQEMIEYCIQDVTIMPRLRRRYRSKLCDAWWTKILAESKTRTELAQDPDWDSSREAMWLGPSEWRTYEPKRREWRTRTMFTEEGDVQDAHIAEVNSVENDYDSTKETLDDWQARLYGELRDYA